VVHTDKDIANFLTCVAFRPFAGLLFPAEQKHPAFELHSSFLSTFFESTLRSIEEEHYIRLRKEAEGEERKEVILTLVEYVFPLVVC